MRSATAVLALASLCVLLLGSTCMVVEETPDDTPYGDESPAEAMREEQVDEVMRDSER